MKRIPWWVFAGAGGVALLLLGPSTAKAYTLNPPTTTDGFIRKLWNALSAFGLSNYAKAALIGQAAYESGWGKGTGAVYGHNYWNVTAGPAWKGPTVQGGDTECDPYTGLICVPITQQWRKYASDEEAIRDFLSFIRDQNGGRYRSAYNHLMAGDAYNYILELGARGYFTANADNYADAVASIQQTVLTRTA